MKEDKPFRSGRHDTVSIDHATPRHAQRSIRLGRGSFCVHRLLGNERKIVFQNKKREEREGIMGALMLYS